jgi:MFS family permease
MSRARAQADSSAQLERPRAEVYTLEGLGALGGVTGCALVGFGGLVLSASVMPGAMYAWPLMVGAVAIAAPVAAGLATDRVGRLLKEDGSKKSAIIAAFVSLAPAAGLGLLGYYVSDNRGSRWVSTPLFALAVTLVPAGATVGYNLTTTGAKSIGSVRDRLEPPGIALTRFQRDDGVVGYGVKLQLAAVRF